jgi:hypothetical protein
MATKKNQGSDSEPITPTQSRLDNDATVAASSDNSALLFGKGNYRMMLIGLALVVLGFILMSGGAMPDANTWDEGVIYSFTRITLAPIVILIGLGVEIYAIFIKKD